MTGRDVSSRLALAISLVVMGCYDVPKPACGFRCGPELACPADYTCGGDGRCRLNGSSPDLACPLPDARDVPDAYSPAVVMSTPAPGALADPATPIQVRFDVDVLGVNTSTFGVTAAATTPPTGVTGTVVYDSPTHTATFTAAEGLPPNQPIAVLLTSGITDPANGRALMPTTFTFQTGPDTTSPTVSSTMPADGATNVSVATVVTLRFSEQVMNVNATNLTLVEAASMLPVTGTVTYANPTRTATFDPDDQLTANLAYEIRASNGITDLSGKPLSGFTATFTTGADAVGPGLRVTAPAIGDTNVPVTTNIVVTFDEPVAGVDTTSFQVNGGAVTGTVTMSNGNRTATFDPAADLPAASMITVTLSSAITDAAGNPHTASMFSFTTP